MDNKEIRKLRHIEKYYENQIKEKNRKCKKCDKILTKNITYCRSCYYEIMNPKFNKCIISFDND
jgi:hypothetical protein